jgi:hypothetical protein
LGLGVGDGALGLIFGEFEGFGGAFAEGDPEEEGGG